MSIVTTPVFRLSFPALFSPAQMSGKYECDCLFESDADLTALKELASATAQEAWGGKMPSNARSPFRDQKDKDKYGGYVSGNIFITIRSIRKPGVVDEDVQPIIDASKIYGGCYCRAVVNCYAYSNPGQRPGIAFGLQHIQKVRDGEPFGDSVAADASEFFEPVNKTEAKSASTPALDFFK